MVATSIVRVVRVVLILAVAWCSCVNGVRSIKDTPFLQETPTISTYAGFQKADWTQLPFSEEIKQVESLGVDNCFLFLTNNSLYIFQNNNISSFSNVEVDSDTRLKTISANTFIVATSSALYKCQAATPYCSLLGSYKFGTVNALDVAFQNYYIGTGAGLFAIDAQTFNISQVSYVVDPVNAIAVSLDGKLLTVGSDNRLYVFDGSSWSFQWVGFIIDGAISCLAFDNNKTLWIGNPVSINLMYNTGAFDRISGPTGLPYGNITTLSYQASLDVMWAGTTKGAMRYLNGNWKYYYGPRWVNGDTVNSIASSLSTYSTIVVLDGGISNITFQYWTLASKADFFQNMVKAPTHLRYGFAGGCKLAEFGIIDGCVQLPDDNDGLWTSMYLASQIFRYAATKSEDALANAWESFEGMEMLNKVTGVPGFPARSYNLANGTLPGAWWTNSTAYPGLAFKGNTSSDEMVGHMFVYPLFHDLICKTDEERSRPLQLIYNITNYIVENDFYLMQDGKHTGWGVWNPTELNGREFWGDERGPNSLQILAWLSNAYLYTGDEKFMTAFDTLANDYGYATNLINTKVTFPGDLNYSDDELIFLSYFTFFYAGGNKFLQKQLDVSLQRAWNIARPIKSSLWNTIYGMFNKEADFDLENVIWTLQNWPLSQIDWPTFNSHRKDYVLNSEAYLLGNQLDSLELLPWDERDFFVWNTDPFTLDDGSGYYVNVPTHWLLPYWMAVYAGFIHQ